MCFFRENLISSILPTTLYLGDNVHRQMDNLWNKTASDGRERAGTFVLDKDGNLQLVNIEIGSAIGVNINEEALICTNLDLCERYGLAFYRGKTKNKLYWFRIVRSHIDVV